MLLVLFAACIDTPTTPSRVEGYAAAKPGGPADPTATWKIPLADAGLGFASDGQYGDGTYSVYADGVCGVSAKSFETTAAWDGGRCDDPDRQERRTPPGDSPCAIGCLTTEVVPSFNNLLQLQNTTYLIPLGSTVSAGSSSPRGSRTTPRAAGGSCSGL